MQCILHMQPVDARAGGNENEQAELVNGSDRNLHVIQ